MSALLVERCGPLVTVQDRGRRGHAAHGIPASGPWDREVFEAALAAVGGREDDAAIEIPLHGARFLVDGTVLASIDGETPREVHDDAIEVTPHARAVRYLAIRGGVDVPVVLGARATLINAGFGGFSGRPLRKGDRLPIGVGGVSPRFGRALDSADVLDVLPTFDAPPESLASLWSTSFTVDPRSDRVGTRLVPATPLPVPAGERLSRPVVPGAIQLPPDGRPIVLGPDGPTTGGYPLLAVLDGRARSHLARVRPGGVVRFRARV